MNINNLFYAMQAEKIADLVPPPIEMYVVMAYNKKDGYWKLHRETREHEFATIESARSFAQKLSACWTFRMIVKMPLWEMNNDTN